MGVRRVVGAAVLAAAVAACGPGPGSPPDLLVSVGAGTLSAPASIGSGWARIRVEEDPDGHVVVLFRLLDDGAGIAAFLAALDTADATPAAAVAHGGPEVGRVGEILVELAAGTYLLACVRRGEDGHRHAAGGEAAVLRVTAAPRAAAGPPTATQDVPMVDFAYPGADRWVAGDHLLRVENRGAAEHQVRIDRLHAGSSLKQWMEADEPGEHGDPLAGVARMGAGTVAFLPVRLGPGRYVLYCLVTDPGTGRQHVELGMLREISVE